MIAVPIVEAIPDCDNIWGINGPVEVDPEAVTEDPVNIRNGNSHLLVEDIGIKSRGPDLQVTRKYNAQMISAIEGWTPEAGTWVVEDEEFSGEGDRIVSNNSYTDLTLDVDMRTITPGELDHYVGWINFRYVDLSNTYYLNIRKGGILELSKIKAGMFHTLHYAQTAYSPLNWNTIRIEAAGNRIRVYVNNTLQIDVIDADPLSSGRIGLNAFWSHAHYDNIDINDGVLTYDFNGINPHEQTIFGYGWFSNLEEQIIEQPNGDAIFKDRETNEYRFTPNGNGTYSRPANRPVYDDLVKHGSGFTLTTSARWKYEFDLDGKLQQYIDRNGNALSVLYNAAGKPATIQDAVGRTLTLTYGSNGKVSQIEDPVGRITHYMYDTYGHLTQVWFPTPQGEPQIMVEYGYDAVNHNMEWRRDRNGNLFQDTYIYNDRVRTQIDPLGNVTTFTYDWDFTDIVNDKGEKYRYVFVDGGYLTQEIDPKGNTITYEYDPKHNKKRITDKLGNVTEKDFDVNGNVVEQRQFVGGHILKTVIDYDLDLNLPLRITDPQGKVTDFVYDARGNLLEETRYLRSVPVTTTYTYNAFGELLSVTNANNDTVAYEYDQYGNMTKIIDPTSAHHETVITYDSVSRLRTRTDARSKTTTFEYDVKNDLITTKDHDNNESTFTYDAKGNLVIQTNPLLKSWTFTYDGLDNLITQKDPLLNTTNRAYDTDNFMHLGVMNLRSVTDPEIHSTTNTYNELDQLIKTTNAEGHDVFFKYGANGNLIKLTNARGAETDFEYNELGQLMRTTDPLGNSTEFTYNHRGDVLTRRDANGYLTTYVYDDLYRLIKIVYDDSSTVEYEYDKVGNRLLMSDATGDTTYEYDELNRLTHVVYPNGRTVAYTYDAVGNRATMVTSLGTTTYGYDNNNRLITILDHNGQLTQFQYDSAGRRTKIIYPNQMTCDYTYDAANRITALVYKKSDQTGLSSFSYAYDRAGNIVSVTDNNGQTTYGYDALYQLRNVEYFDDTAESFTYDAAGNRATMTSRQGNNVTYVYDMADRVINAGDTAFRYDNNGNMLTKMSPGGTIGYAYDHENRMTHLIESSFAYNTHLNPGWNMFALPGHPIDPSVTTVLQGVSFPGDIEQISRYNAANSKFEHYVGNEKFDQFANLEYGRGYEAYVTKPNGVDLALESLASYEDIIPIEAGWNLVGAPHTGPVAVEDGFNNLAYNIDYTDVAQYDGAGYEFYSHGDFTTLDPNKAYFLSATASNVWQTSTTTQSKAVYAYNGDGQRVRREVDGVLTNYYYDIDHVFAETNGNDAVTASYVHGPSIDEIIYQNKAASGDHYFIRDRLGSTRGLVTPSELVAESYAFTAYGENITQGTLTEYQYAGRPLDAETGLYYNRNRYYNSALGRFTTADPIGMQGGLNLYTYVGNNPINFIDPWGLCAEDNDSIEPVPLWEDPIFLSLLGVLKGYQATIQAYNAMKGAREVGDAFNPNNTSGSQVGVDGRTVTPSKDLNTLDRGRLDSVERLGDNTVTVDRNGRVLDGHHRLKNSIDRNRAIDLIIRD
jgi:RHS repeat-associated protein